MPGFGMPLIPSVDPIYGIGGLFAYWSSDRVLQSGGTVSKVIDISGNNNSARDLSAVSTQPIYTAYDPNFNYRASISGTAINTRMQSTFDTAMGNPCTTYLVCNMSTNANTVFWQSNSGNFTNSAGLFASGGQLNPSALNAGGSFATTAVANGNHVVCTVYNNASSAVYVDSSVTAVGSGTLDTAAPTVMTIGSFASAVNYSWCCMLVYSGAHTLVQRQKVMDFLQHKYLDVGPTAGVFDPATLSLTGWWRASFSGAPWTPTASAGSSASNGNLVVGTAPSTGTAVNGLTPASFNGTSHYLTGGTTGTFYSTGSGSLWCLCKPTTTAVVASAGYDEPAVISTNQAIVNITYTTSGFGFVFFDTGYKIARTAATAGSWHLAQMKWDGSNLRYRVDNGAWTDLAAGPMSSSYLVYPIQMGTNYSAVTFFAGDVLEYGTCSTTLTDTDFDNIRLYANSRYGLAL